MMCQQFRLCRGMLAQILGNSAVQYLAPGFEEVFVSCVLNESMLEAIIGIGRHALD